MIFFARQPDVTENIPPHSSVWVNLTAGITLIHQSDTNKHTNTGSAHFLTLAIPGYVTRSKTRWSCLPSSVSASCQTAKNLDIKTGVTTGLSVACEAWD